MFIPRRNSFRRFSYRWMKGEASSLEIFKSEADTSRIITMESLQEKMYGKKPCGRRQMSLPQGNSATIKPAEARH